MAIGPLGTLNFLGMVVGLDDRFTAGARRIGFEARAMKTAMGGAGSAGTAMSGTVAIAAVAAGVAMFGAASQAAEFERQTTLAGFAAGGYKQSADGMRQSAMQLSREMKKSPTEMAALTKEVAQLGNFSDATAFQLSRAAAALNIMTGGEIESDFAATALFRLLNITKQAGESIDDLAGDSMKYASAIKVAGDASAAGADDTLLMLRRMQSVAVMANFSRGELIALAAAFGDVDETARDMFTTSIQRLFAKEFADPDSIQKMSEFLGLTTEEFTATRDDSPLALMVKFAETLQTLKPGGQLATLAELGFTNVRDLKTIQAFIASYDKLLGTDGRPGILEEVNRELGVDDESQLEIVKQLDIILGQLTASWHGFTAALQRAGITIGTILAPALQIMLGALTGIASFFADNPFVTGLLLAGGVAMAGRAGLRMFRGRRGARADDLANEVRNNRVGVMEKSGMLLGSGQAGGRTSDFAGIDPVDAALMASMFFPTGRGGAAKVLGGKTGFFARMFTAAGKPDSRKARQAAKIEGGGIFSMMKRSSAGLLGRAFGGKGAQVAGRLGSSALGRVALGGGIPGIILALMPLIGMLGTGLGEMLDKLGDKLPLLRPFIEIIGSLLRVIGFAATAISDFFESVIDGVTDLIPSFVKDAWEGLGDFLEFGPGRGDGAGGGKAVTSNLTFNIQTSSDSATRIAAEQVSVQAVNSLSNASFRGSGA